MRASNGAILPPLEPPSIKCDVCGGVDVCDCEYITCLVCGRPIRTKPIAEDECSRCGYRNGEFMPWKEDFLHEYRKRMEDLDRKNKIELGDFFKKQLGLYKVPIAPGPDWCNFTSDGMECHYTYENIRFYCRRFKNAGMAFGIMGNCPKCSKYVYSHHIYHSNGLAQKILKFEPGPHTCQRPDEVEAHKPTIKEIATQALSEWIYQEVQDAIADQLPTDY